MSPEFSSDVAQREALERRRVAPFSVTTDRNGTSEKASGRAVANVQGFHADLTVALDLRSLPPGAYFLATTHEGDPASYFYPLSVIAQVPETYWKSLGRSHTDQPIGPLLKSLSHLCRKYR